MNNLTGYVTPRKFGGYSLPVPIQNKLLRNYCNENGLQYVLPQNEMIEAENYTYLFDTLKKIDPKSYLGMCSIKMLPSNPEKLKKLIQLMERKSIICHFVFEDITCESGELIRQYNLTQIHKVLGIHNKKVFEEIFF